jgi:hypothetical protein
MSAQVKTFESAKQLRLDELLEKNAADALLPAERSELESLVAEAERLMIDNARVLADFARDHTPQPPLPAMPVTVWVTPQQADP